MFSCNLSLIFYDFSPVLFSGNDLNDRIFNMQHPYKDNEASLTPSSVAFAQVIWDISVKEALHALGAVSFLLCLQFAQCSSVTFAVYMYVFDEPHRFRVLIILFGECWLKINLRF